MFMRWQYACFSEKGYLLAFCQFPCTADEDICVHFALLIIFNVDGQQSRETASPKDRQRSPCALDEREYNNASVYFGLETKRLVL